MAIKKNEDPEDLEEQLEELDRKVDRLRVLFEQFFLGIEKRPPLGLQKEVVRLMRHIGNYHIRKTSLKFRFQSITQRFNVHRAYWTRTMREIEEGTFRRDRSRAERREVARTGEKIDAAELAKRTTLRQVLGEEAVEERRQRLSEDLPSSTPDDYVPAVARRRTQRSRRSAADIRGVSADTIAAQVTEAKGISRDAAAGDSQTAPDTPAPLESARPRPSLRRAPAGESEFGAPLASPPSLAANNGGTEAPRPRAVPTLSRRPSAPSTPTTMPSPAAAASPTGASSPGPTEVLRNAGLPPERVERIYRDWLQARERAGQPTQGVSRERLAESMARQVPKLRESHGALRVDFEVVTKDDKVFLKPRTK